MPKKQAVAAHRPHDSLGLLLIRQLGDAATADVLGQAGHVRRFEAIHFEHVGQFTQLALGTLDEQHSFARQDRRHVGGTVPGGGLGRDVGRSQGFVQG
jgi:hypothetical protein